LRLAVLALLTALLAGLIALLLLLARLLPALLLATLLPGLIALLLLTRLLVLILAHSMSFQRWRLPARVLINGSALRLFRAPPISNSMELGCVSRVLMQANTD
jgi:hypothetical protein